jgi:pimeloyl-ACP methyl ester carboxylesterase
VLGVSAPLPPASPITCRAVRYVALSPKATPAQVAFCQELVLACRRDVRAGCGRTLSKLDLADAIEHLTVPTVVIAGEGDRLTPPSHAARLERLLPDSAGVVELERVGHMAPVEAHQQVNAAVRQLADRVLSARSTAAA